MTYLVDANVLSEATKSSPNGNVLEWLRLNEANLVVDPIILGEICAGILALPGGRKRAGLETWFENVVVKLDCLPWDATVSRRWAQLVVELNKKGKTLPILDAMIAATALAHDLTVATHNVGHFKKAGVKVVDPFVWGPSSGQ